MKKLLVLLHTLLLCVGIACAEDVTINMSESAELEYSLLEDGTVEIVNYNGRAEKLTIPVELDSYRVTAIGELAFYDCTFLTSITIPDSVTSIGECAFEGCTSLTSITIPDSVTSIGDDAFEDCTSLTSITIPNGVNSIGGYAFRDCTSLLSITIPDSVTSIGWDAFSGCDSLTLIVGRGSYARLYAINENLNIIYKDVALAENAKPTVCEKGDYRYTLLKDGTIEIVKYHGRTEELIVPTQLDGYRVTAIGDNAFSECDFLTSVIVPSGVTSIGVTAFANCASLMSVTIPDGVTSIGAGTFANCTSLMSVTIPDGVTSTGVGTFANCTSLMSVTIPDSVTSIGGTAFGNCTSLKNITIPNSVTAIDDGAFYSCQSLLSISIPNSVMKIGMNPFVNCYKLTEITISADHPILATIDGVLFEKSEKKLICYPCAFSSDSYSIPQGILAIGALAFSSCNSLTQVNIPNSVIDIGTGAFQDCSPELTLIVRPGSYAEKYAGYCDMNFVHP